MKTVEVFDYANHILAAVKKGVLLTTMADGQVNTMSISWGTLGIQWNKPIFTVFVRGSRHTSTLLDKNPEFTINIPYGEFDQEIIRFCGSKSGRDVNKFEALGLTLTQPQFVSVPGIRELPLTLACRVVYAQQQYPENVLDSEIFSHYPAESQDVHADYHTAYYGEIVGAYFAE